MTAVEMNTPLPIKIAYTSTQLSDTELVIHSGYGYTQDRSDTYVFNTGKSSFFPLLWTGFGLTLALSHQRMADCQARCWLSRRKGI